MIIDPGVKLEANYSVYERGLEQDVYIRFGATAARGDAPTDYVVGKVWPGHVNFPDFTHPNASSYWTSELAAFRKVVRAPCVLRVATPAPTVSSHVWHHHHISLLCVSTSSISVGRGLT